tara:strand:- start:56 stop:613 length:558 start_codon:yes stop_codon:yes gene_type:complete
MVDHHVIKDRILSEISKTFGDTIPQNNSYYCDSVSKLDWSCANDWNREWVKILLPNFYLTAKKFLKECAYKELQLVKMWYQQYQKGDQHGWHIHGDHYTGVYYLEYPKSAAKTQICSPYNLRSKKIEGVEEGDMIIFPAHWIHRGLKNGKDRKTIVSYNFSINADSLLDTKLVGSVNNKKPYIIF